MAGPGGPGAPPPEAPRYLPGGELGRGATGVVEAVVDTHLGRTVARKLLRDGASAARLFREARITATLEHPGIVPVYDAGTDEAGRPWYTMRVAAGRTLADALAEAPDLAERLRLVRRLLAACEAMSYAHTRGVVHRDLKPANILVGAHGETQVADWGLAVRRGEPTEGEGVVGTPAWMSPEQARGLPVDARTDVYSLGAILAALISGRPPFAGQPSDEILGRLREGGPTPPVPAGAVPELVAIARRAMAPDPADRYADAGALAEDLSRWLEGRRGEAHAYTAAELAGRLIRRWRVPLGVAAVGASALLVLAAVAYVRTEAARRRAVQAEGATAAALSESDGHLSQALLSQGRAALRVGAMAEAELLGARALLLGRDVAEARGLLAGATAAPAAARVGHEPAPACERRALDDAGERLACAETDAVSLWAGQPLQRRWRVAGRAERVALRGGPVFVVQADRLRVLDEADGHELAAFDGVPADWNLDLAPDGSRAWSLTFTSPVLALDVRTGARRELRPCGAVGATLHVAVAAHEAYACDDGRVLLDGRELPSPLERTLGRAERLSLAPDGARLAVSTYQGEVVVFGDPGEPVAFTPDGSVVRDLRLGDDGRLLLSTERGGPSVWDARTGQRQVQLPRAAVEQVRWLPGGELGVLGAELSRWAAPRTAAPWRLHRGHGVAAVAVAADGTALASAHGDGAVALWRLEDGAQRLLRWQQRVAKDVAFVGDTVVGAGVGWAPPRRFSRAGVELGDWRHARVEPFRRVEALGSGLIGASYAAAGPFWWPDGPDALPVDLGLGDTHDLGGTPDGREVLVASATGVARVHADGRVERLLPDAEVRAVDAGPDGRVALADAAGLRVGEPGALRTMAAVPDTLVDVALSPDGARVAAAGVAGVAWVWDTRSGELLATLRGHDGRVAAVEFAADGEALFTGGWDGAVRRWALPALSAPPERLLADVQARTGLRLEAVLAVDYR